MNHVFNTFIHFYGCVTALGIHPIYLGGRPQLFLVLFVYDFKFLYFKCEVNTTQFALLLSKVPFFYINVM
jgi:hypothetical protein